jgi:hypothetical protein
MRQIEIQHFHARYRLPKSAKAERRRLDGLLENRLDKLLERTVDRVGLTPEEQICLRHVFVPVRVRLSGTDQSILESWSQALAESIHQAIHLQGARDRNGILIEVVRYSSRAQALADLAARVSRGDTTRAWAWRQLGLWQTASRISTTEATQEMLQALAGEATMIVPVLKTLAERRLLEAFAARLSADDWIALAAAALRAVGSSITWQDIVAMPQTQAREFASPFATLGRETAALADRLVRSSRLARAFTQSGNMPAAQGALSILVLLEASPSLARKPRQAVMNIVAAIQTARESGQTATSVPERKVNAPEPAIRFPEPQLEDNPLLEFRPRAFTQYGGLLFLLTVLDHLGLPGRIPEMFPDRPVRWVLHKLALTLTPVASDNAAALAFAGLAPTSQPPDHDDPAAAPAQSDADTEPALASASAAPERNEVPSRGDELLIFSSIVEEICAELIRRLQPLELPHHALVEFICMRPAEIVADPGWIEAHFPLDSVATEIRRAALDLDPGFVPWLGVIIKFFYE